MEREHKQSGVTFTYPVIRVGLQSGEQVDVVGEHVKTAIWMEGATHGRKNYPVMYGNLDWTQARVVTVHGSQGYEFEYGVVNVNAEHCFDWHMALVAMTRFFKAENVRVRGGRIEWNAFGVHPKLLEAIGIRRKFTIEAICAAYDRMMMRAV